MGSNDAIGSGDSTSSGASGLRSSSIGRNALGGTAARGAGGLFVPFRVAVTRRCCGLPGGAAVAVSVEALGAGRWPPPARGLARGPVARGGTHRSCVGRA